MQFRSLRKTILFGAIFLLAMSLFVQTAAIAAPKCDAEIISVTCDLDNEVVYIIGDCLPESEEDIEELTLGGVSLVVTDHNDTQITASLPSPLADGDYLLRLHLDDSGSNYLDYDLTVGAVGPPGMVWRGLYSSHTDYYEYDAVYEGKTGSSYICVSEPCGSPVGLGDKNWELLAKRGATGLQGIQGIQGVKGDKGDTGDTGAQGLKGDKGDTGDTGAQGLKGDKGDTGDTGAQGLKGDKGDQGIQGIQGVKGDKGDQGIQGIQGVKGDKGDTGDTGAQGIQGETGPQGIQGDQGNTGATGSKGDTGDTGPPGPVAGLNEQFIYNNNGNAAGANVWYNDSNDGTVGIGTQVTGTEGRLIAYRGEQHSGSLATSTNGVYGKSSSQAGSGVAGENYSTGPGVYGWSQNGNAGWFQGDVKIDGDIVGKLSIVRGTVGQLGTVVSGEGWSVFKEMDGIYRITFDKSFSDIPTVTATSFSNYNAVVGNIHTTNCDVYILDAIGGGHKSHFSFIAIGQRQ